ncbi:MAG: hypothetical protein N2652_00875 [Kiritimatiellae bacterium]|nr:hypothetical protein [Kiritimatiellia bacterium]
MHRMRRRDRHGREGLTLLEALVAAALFTALLALVIIPAIAQTRRYALRAACAANLRQMHTAWIQYLADHGGRFFPFREDRPDGVLWYWGFEPGGGGPEGQRPLDKSRARLAPYLPHGAVELCPTLPIRAPYFKRKFIVASYGYGINGYLLADLPGTQRMGVFVLNDVQRPGETVAWGDCIQINTWQAPASPERPMLEEWYVLDSLPPPHTHFRHGRLANLTLVDGSLRAFEPAQLDPRCDGLAGYIDEPRSDRWFATRK